MCAGNVGPRVRQAPWLCTGSVVKGGRANSHQVLHTQEGPGVRLTRSARVFPGSVHSGSLARTGGNRVSGGEGAAAVPRAGVPGFSPRLSRAQGPGVCSPCSPGPHSDPGALRMAHTPTAGHPPCRVREPHLPSEDASGPPSASCVLRVPKGIFSVLWPPTVRAADSDVTSVCGVHARVSLARSRAPGRPEAGPGSQR